ncbi:MAG: hypothetical protein ABSA72_11985 [Nitrososphaerales archaeon]|jgi:hypothetical protein
MTSNQAPKEKSAKKRVRFFNFSLRNGIVMSTPSYPEKQSFVAHLIRALETSNPDFAWVQFLFVRSDYGTELVKLKNSMHRAKTAIEQPSLDLISGQEQDRKQLHRDFYRKTDSRMKKVDDVVTKPTITMAIQGLWVSTEPDSIKALPFDHCSDEHDSLALFRYKDPRMLIELVNRRMVVDISEYFDRYTKSRLEPPSFLVTPEELQSYIHLPAGDVAESLRSLQGEASKREYSQGKVEGEETSPTRINEISSKLVRLVRLVKVPRYEEALEDTAVQPLTHLAAPTVRTFELVYSGGKTEVLLSAETVEDMKNFAGSLDLVYGAMTFQAVEPYPSFLRELPALVGVTA